MPDKVIGRMLNWWRMRDVTVYEISGDAEHVRTVGVPINEHGQPTGAAPVECVEEIDAWLSTIAAFPKTYIYN